MDANLNRGSLATGLRNGKLYPAKTSGKNTEAVKYIEHDIFLGDKVYFEVQALCAHHKIRSESLFFILFKILLFKINIDENHLGILKPIAFRRRNKHPDEIYRHIQSSKINLNPKKTLKFYFREDKKNQKIPKDDSEPSTLFFYKNIKTVKEIPQIIKNLSDINAELIFTVLESTIGYHVIFLSHPRSSKKYHPKNFSDYFSNLIKSCLQNSSLKIHEIEILSPQEKHFLSFGINKTQKKYSQDKTIHEIIEARCALHPQKTAIIFKDQKISYQELNERSNQLAHFLKEQNIRKETLVGLMMSRSVEMLVGILGILKAGGTYVPIDPNYPEKRIQHILESSQCPLILSERKFFSKTQSLKNKVFNWEEIADLLKDESRSNLKPISRPNSLCYVIYTSGSTGLPKGVMVEHHNLVNFTEAIGEILSPTESGVLAGLTTLSFDIFGLEFFGALNYGMTFLLIDEEAQKDLYLLKDTLTRYQVTHLQMTPTVLNQFLELASDGSGIFSHLKKLFVGGEAIHEKTVKKLRELYSGDFYNMYGPTETTIWSTYEKIGKSETDITIGRPIQNTQAYILDPQLNLVPAGFAGELYIGGEGVGRGYWKDKDKTAERFIDNPYIPKSKMYRTGDVCRLTREHKIEYIGRADFQVKVRGHRIELGEIENVLLHHPKIKNCIAIVREDKQSTYIAAYYIAHREVSESELRQELAGELPAYMIPQHLVELKNFPLTPNGKIDRQALPDPTQLISHHAKERVAPRNDIEKKLLQIWQEVLGVEKIGVHENFFFLGGHSLKAMQAHARIRKEFNIDISLKNIFETPRISALSEKIAEQQKKHQKTDKTEIMRLPDQEHYELSSFQRSQWFLYKMEPDNPSYNVSWCIRIKGHFQENIFQKSLDNIVNRHEILRTNFEEFEGKPFQKIKREIKFDYCFQDLSHQENADSLLHHSLQEDVHRPFNLETEPLLRCRILRLSPDSHVVQIVIHHIASDAWSFEIIRNELIENYNALLENRSPNLSELEVQYKDYAHWHNRILKSPGLKRQEHYWLKRFSGELPSLELPTDYPRPAVLSHHGSQETIHLETELSEQLNSLSQQNSATLFMTLLAAVYVWLFKITGHSDIVLGTPIADRDEKSIENLIGFFVNTLALRIRLDEHQTITGFLDSLRKQCLEAYDHADFPFEKLVQKIIGTRDPGQNPIFNTMFVYDKGPEPQDEKSFKNLNFQQLESGIDIIQFDLMVLCSVNKGNIRLSLKYRTELFKKSSAQNFLSQIKTILKCFTTHPHQTLHDINLLSKSEENKILYEFNDNKTVYLKKSFHELFEEQALKTPENTAVVYENERLNYRELNEQADRLASYLKSIKVGPEIPVGILLDRSPKLIVAMLAIFKACGAFVPLDPQYPKDRLEYMIRDADISILLTFRHLKDRIPDSSLKDAIYLDDEWPDILKNENGFLSPKANLDNLAYVIYTSGSTGKPKGVLVTHQGMGNVLSTDRHIHKINQHSRIIQFSSLGFDVLIHESMMALGNGAQLILPRFEKAVSGNDLASFLEDNKITHLSLTPSALTLLPEKHYPHLQVIAVAGEPCSLPLAQKWCKDYTFLNLYGATECSCYSTAAEIKQSDDKMHIGKPVPNIKIYILDSEQKPVPIGVTGEICIGGVALARGYLNQAQLTREKFISNPFSKDPEERIYKTGDLARWLPDGNIEFVGRKDHQIKIRGFRVELGEIEAVLTQVNGVTGSTVSTHGEGSLKKIIAYYTGDKISQTALKEALSQKLPYYMVPSQLIHLKKIPIAPTGKIDRNALPDPGEKFLERQKYIVPKRKDEKILSDIWKEVLGIQKIGVYDDFFLLGGNSLQTVQIHSRILEKFSVDLPIKKIFENSSLEKLAECISKHARSVKKISIERISKQPYYELSHAQKRLWFLDQYERDSGFYNIPLSFLIQGDFKEEIFKRAFQNLIDRHDILRTIFQEQSGKPMAIIQPMTDLPLETFDFRQYSQDKKEQFLQEKTYQETHRPFSLNTGPLIRGFIFRLEDKLFQIHLVTHHIVSDGWSIGIIEKELEASYNASLKNRDPALDELPIQYQDYAAWQNQQLDSELFLKQKNYWLTQLAGDLPILDLPTDNPRPAVMTFHGSQEQLFLNKDLLLKIKQIGLRDGETLFILTLAVFNLWLWKLTGQEELIVGIPVAGRNWGDIENLIGFFVNTLALRTHIHPTDTFLEFLHRIKNSTLEAFDHQDYPFDLLIEALNPERDPSRSPIFSAMFSITEGMERKSFCFNGTIIKKVKVDYGHAKFDLLFNVEPTDEGLLLALDYNTDLFDAKTIHRFLNYYHNLLEVLVEAPQSQLKDIEILKPYEKDQLLFDFNDESSHQKKCFHELFEDQALNTPENIAVVYENEQFTYQELNDRAHQLASHLVSLNVGPDTLVGLLFDRSPKMIVSILAILKAGGAYVPLDPNYPPDRLEYMVQDSNISILITHQHLKDKVPTSYQNVILNIDEWKPKKADKILSLPKVKPRNLAYVIYTSGSTGKPKGVLTTHEGIGNLMKTQVNTYKITAQSKILQSTSMSFDPSVLEILMAFGAGAELHLPPSGVPLAGKLMADYLKNHKITHLFQTPSSLALIPQEGLTDLKVIIVAGEPCPLSLAKAWQHNRRFFNVYGATECTCYSTIGEIKSTDHKIHVGKPIPNQKIYIVDSEHHLLPVGITGEICIGGIGIGRGYLNQAELTQEKFIADPFIKKRKNRIYKTGDLGRWLPDGNIEFIGRKDHQIKIRGFRIELGEIESTLCRHKLIKESSVLAIGEGKTKHLLAYYTGQILTKNELKEFLKKFLPDYMTPRDFYHLEKMPLTSTGKANRKELEKIAKLKKREDLPPSLFPDSDVEQKLLHIWRDILEVGNIGFEDNFFDLGGHSLSAVQLISQINQEFGANISLKQVFQNPTVSSLSRLIGKSIEKAENTFSLKIERLAFQDSYELSPSQRRLWFLDRLESDNPFYNIPWSLRFEGNFQISHFVHALREVCKRHDILRSRFAETDGIPMQIINREPSFEFKYTDFSHEEIDSKAYRNLLLKEAHRPFDLNRGPLLRCHIVCLKPELYEVHFSMHHIIADGWSLGVLEKDLAEIYNSLINGYSPRARLAELPVQYQDFSQWQNGLLKENKIKSQEKYWLDRFEGELPTLDLPIDKPRPKTLTYHGACVQASFDPILTKDLKVLNQAQGNTLFMSLLSIFQLWLWKLTGQEDLIVGIPIACRNRSDVQNLIGFFANTLPIRSRIDGEETFEKFLSQIKSRVLEALENQDYPFDQLVEKLNPERNPSRSPIFSAAFSLENVQKERTEFSGVKKKTIDIDYEFSKFELSLSVRDEGDQLRLNLEYNTDLFSRNSVERFLSSYSKLAKNLLENSSKRLKEIKMLDQSEHHQILNSFNNTQSPYPANQSIHEGFEKQVLQTPDDFAISFGHEKLSYEALNRQANQFAHFLKEKLLKEETIVAILLHPGVEYLITILATLKAGKSYLTLDHNLPIERLENILQDSSSVTIVSDVPLPLNNGKVKNLLWSEFKQQQDSFSKENLKIYPASREAAYVIYTSGSTGTPKGVVLSHRGLSNLCHWHRREFHLDRKSRASQYASLGFDACVWEVWPYLLAGACIFPVNPEIALSAKDLQAWMSENQITHSFLPTPIAEEFFLLEQPTNFSLQYLFTGGDRLKRLPIKGNSYRIINNYGPTETTVVATSGAVNEKLSIGRPIDNCQILILDSSMRIVPVGVKGEIYIAGDNVGLGYLNNPEKTQKSFLPNPYSKEKNAIIYKTGDLGRWLENGEIEFLGRNDHQIKIRGFRIELAEIESNLTTIDGIKESLVLAYGEADSKQLVAYYTGTKLDQEKIKEALSKKLPNYMLPSLLIHLEKMPLSPSGKINSKALPAPDESFFSRSRYNAPRNEIEEKLTRIWRRVLGIKKIGIDDNFFNLGGHSLKVVQVQTRVHQELGIDLPLKQFFETPQIASLSQIILKEKSLGKNIEFTLIEKLPFQEHYGLSSSQKRLWFLDRLEPNNPFYNIPWSLRLHGFLDEELFRKALEKVVLRHEILRSVFKEIEGTPVQIIRPGAEFEYRYQDLSHDPKSSQALKKIHLQESHRPFNLAEGPLLRCHILKLGEEDFEIHLTLHHIIADGWSLNIFKEELLHYYSNPRESDWRDLEALPIQYQDFSQWQRRLYQSKKYQSQEKYWLEQLKGELPTLDLPIDKSRPPIQTYRGSSIGVPLDSEIGEKLKSLGAQHGATLFMTLLSAYNLLLHKLTGQKDILVGIPVAGRNHPDIEKLIGFFVNTLVIRCELDEAQSFSDLLERVKTSTLNALENQDYPFEQLIEKLNPERDPSRSPIFSAYFNMVDFDQSHDCDFQSLGEPIEDEHGIAKFDLTLAVVKKETAWEIQFEYRTDLFQAETIHRFANYYRNLLEAVTQNYSIKIADVEILDSREKNKLLIEWNDTVKSFDTKVALHELFERQALRNPNKLAVIDSRHRSTYETLNRRSNQLSHFLIERGLPKEGLVPVIATRSEGLLVGLFAVLKAGGAFVAIDPNQPSERIQAILQESNASIVLTEKSLLDSIPQPFHARCHFLEAELYHHHKAENPRQKIDPDQLAYVVFTSGSTGNPKGVMLKHRSVVNYMDWCGRNLYDAHTVAPLLSNIMFDGAFQQIFGILSHGGTISIPSDLSKIDQMLDFLGTETTLLYAVPSYFEAILEYKKLLQDSEVSLDKVDTLLLGGEPLTVSLSRKLLREFPRAKIINLYGPAETCITSHAEEIRRDAPITLGKPLQNVVSYILDENLKLVPRGVKGEICIGGIGLARGYFNDPEKTREKFVTNPETGETIYRTGDLGKLLEDGSYQFLGRRDHQVKIRGYRVELGEIEAALKQQNDVRDAVVLSRNDSESSPRLVAYLVLDLKDRDFVSPELQEKLLEGLRQKIPNYMLPSQFVALKQFPFTSTGKIDRKALPHPQEPTKSSKEHRTPKNDIERKLLKIWQEAFGTKQIGTDENFFALGGHSLLSVKIVSKIKSRLGENIPLAFFFSHPTIEELAKKIQKQSHQDERIIVPIDRGDAMKTPLFLVHPVSGITSHYIKLRNRLGNHPIYGIQSQGLAGGKILRDIPSMAKAYVQEIKKIQPQGPYLIGGYSLGGPIAFEIVHLLESAGEKVEKLLLIDSAAAAMDEPQPDSFYRQLAQLVVDKNPFLRKMLQGGEVEPVLEVVTANHQTLSDYHTEGTVACPIHLIRCEDYAQYDREILSTWQSHTELPLQVYRVSGDHFNMWDAPNLERLVKAVRQCLDLEQRGDD